MSDERAILATYSDFRLVKSRKVLQIVMEVPIEQATDALNKLGFPDPSGSVWCGIAILDKKASRGGAPTPSAAQQSGEETAAPTIPPGYTKIPNDARCRCIKLWQDASGNFYCCNGGKEYKPRRPFHEMPLSQQAGMRRKEPSFWAYLRSMNWTCSDEATAKKIIHGICEVDSCADLGKTVESAARWKRLEANYQTHLATLQHAETFR